MRRSADRITTPGGRGGRHKERNPIVTFTLKLSGPALQVPGVDAALLSQALGVLVNGSQQALRLRVEGRSTAPGAIPDWVERAAVLRVTSLRFGSAVVELEASRLAEAVPDRFGQRGLFDILSPDDSALGLFEEAVSDLSARREDSELFDEGLVATVRSLDGLFARGVDRLELSGGHKPEVRLDRSSLEAASDVSSRTPSEQRVITAGTLDAIRHSDRLFTLVMPKGEKIRGVLVGDRADAETLRQLFGHKVLVHGLARFRASSRVLRLEAERIEPATGDVSLWDTVPQPTSARLDVRTLHKPQGPRTGVNAVFGKWPGDETDEEIERLLQELS